MATAQSVKSKLQGLIDSANAATGGSDTTLDAAVGTLIAGYGDANAGLLDGTLTEYNNPKLTMIRGYAFYNHSGIQRIIVRNCYEIGNNALRGCSNLAFVDAAVENILSGCFTDDTNIKTIILRRSDAICGLSSATAFSRTPFASDGTGGTVYVPSALITQYQQATNWSTLYAAGTCNFAAIEGSEYE